MHLHQNFFPWEVSALSGSVVGVVFGGFGFGFFFYYYFFCKTGAAYSNRFYDFGEACHNLV